MVVCFVAVGNGLRVFVGAAPLIVDDEGRPRCPVDGLGLISRGDLRRKLYGAAATRT